MFRVLFVFVALGGAMSVFSADKSRLESEFEVAMDRWAQSGTSKYRFTISDVCFCVSPIYTGPLQVLVKNGKVTRLLYVGHSRYMSYGAIVRENTHLRTTVPELFALAKDWLSKRDHHHIAISYDATYGYPSRLQYDHPDIEDEQEDIRITDFKVP